MRMTGERDKLWAVSKDAVGLLDGIFKGTMRALIWKDLREITKHPHSPTKIQADCLQSTNPARCCSASLFMF